MRHAASFFASSIILFRIFVSASRFRLAAPPSIRCVAGAGRTSGRVLLRSAAGVSRARASRVARSRGRTGECRERGCELVASDGLRTCGKGVEVLGDESEGLITLQLCGHRSRRGAAHADMWGRARAGQRRSPARLPAYERLFRIFDADASGALDYDSFGMLLRTRDPAMCEADVQAWIAMVDDDRNGEISMREMRRCAENSLVLHTSPRTSHAVT